MEKEEKIEKVLESFSQFLMENEKGEDKKEPSEDSKDYKLEKDYDELSEEFADIKIGYPKEPVAAKGNPNSAIKILAELNNQIEKSFIEKTEEESKETAEEPASDKIDPSKPDQETPFGNLSNLVTNLAKWVSGGDRDYSDRDRFDPQETDELYGSYTDQEEKDSIEASSDQEHKDSVKKYIGLDVDLDKGAAKSAATKDKAAESQVPPELAKIYDVFPNGGVNRLNQEAFAKSNIDRLEKNETLKEAAKEIEKYPLPKYDTLAPDRTFYGSDEYNTICKNLGVGDEKGGSKFLKSISSMGIGKNIGKVLDGSPTIIFVRPSKKVKNKYKNSFSDIAFFVYKEDGEFKIDAMVASSTPSPSFMNKAWRNSISAKIGLKSINYQDTFILKKAIFPEFKIDAESKKSKFYGTRIITSTKEITNLGNLDMKSSESCQIYSYSPPRTTKARIRVSICPSLPGGGTSQFLDATTSGDLVIQDYAQYENLVEKISGFGSSVRVVILDSREEG
jgi:hypothetical protein